MHQIKLAHKKVIIFSQWSRKNYAVFASLKKIICIARLSIDLCSSSLFKVPASIRLLSFLDISDSEIDDISIGNQLDKLLLTVAILPIVSNNNDIYSQNILINFQYKKSILCSMQSMDF